MLRDKFFIGVIVGLLADAVKLTVNYIGYKLEFTPYVFWQLTGATLLTKEDVYSPAGIIIGGVIDIVITCLLGVMFIYLIYFVGKKHLWLKAIGYAMTVWALLFAIVLRQLIDNILAPVPSGIFVTIAAHFAFGLALAAFTMYFSKDIKTFAEDVADFVKNQ